MLKYFNVLYRAIPLTGGWRKWPFCLRGANRPVRGGTENPCLTANFCPRGSQEKVSEGVKLSKKCLRG